MANEYGSDFSCVDDLNADLSLVSGQLGLAQSVVRRLISPSGSLWYDKDYGVDLRSKISKGYKTANLARQIVSEATKDERVRDANSTTKQIDEFGQEIAITDGLMSPNVEQVEIDIRLLTDQGPYDFTLSVSDVSVAILKG